MRLPYVTYKQAKELKAIGFDEYCGSSYIAGELCHGIGWKASWNFGPEYGFNKDSKPKEQIPAPMYVEVEEWLRNLKGERPLDWPIMIFYKPYITTEPRQYRFFMWRGGKYHDIGIFDSHAEGQSKTIDYIIQLLK